MTSFADEYTISKKTCSIKNNENLFFDITVVLNVYFPFQKYEANAPAVNPRLLARKTFIPIAVNNKVNK